MLHDVANQLRRKGIIIVISDFFDDEAKVLEGIQHLRFGGTHTLEGEWPLSQDATSRAVTVPLVGITIGWPAA